MSKINLGLEKKRLSDIAVGFSMKTGFNGKLEKYRILTIRENLKGDEILDIGCADGFMVKALSKYFKHITAIDGSEELINRAKQHNLKNVDFIHTLFEEFEPTSKFDSIILSDILEHVRDPIQLLNMARRYVKNDGVILALCPNANSIHRNIGVLAGMLKDVHNLNKSDKSVGHRRVYGIDSLSKDIKSAKLKIVKWGGMFLKPLSNDQMNQLDNKIIDAFYLIGKKLPQEFLTEIYVQAKK